MHHHHHNSCNSWQSYLMGTRDAKRPWSLSPTACMSMLPGRSVYYTPTTHQGALAHIDRAGDHVHRGPYSSSSST